MIRRLSTSLLTVFALLSFVAASYAQLQPITRHTRDAVMNGQAAMVAHVPGNQQMDLTFQLPLRNESQLRTFLQDIIVGEVGPRVDNPPGSGRTRVQFVASQLVGVVMARYILELEPFKSLSVEQVAEAIGPNLQRYLTGELPGLG